MNILIIKKGKYWMLLAVQGTKAIILEKYVYDKKAKNPVLKSQLATKLKAEGKSDKEIITALKDENLLETYKRINNKEWAKNTEGRLKELEKTNYKTSGEIIRQIQKDKEKEYGILASTYKPTNAEIEYYAKNIPKDSASKTIAQYTDPKLRTNKEYIQYMNQYAPKYSMVDTSDKRIKELEKKKLKTKSPKERLKIDGELWKIEKVKVAKKTAEIKEKINKKEIIKTLKPAYYFYLTKKYDDLSNEQIIKRLEEIEKENPKLKTKGKTYNKAVKEDKKLGTEHYFLNEQLKSNQQRKNAEKILGSLENDNQKLKNIRIEIENQKGKIKRKKVIKEMKK